MHQDARQPVVIRAITAQATHPLRHAVLRPHQRPDDMIYDGDDLPSTLHLGAFAQGADPQDMPVAVVSLYTLAMPADARPGDWRLRGMAVAPGWHRQGVGAQLIRDAIDAIQSRGGQRIWCNARQAAMGFYTRLGFALHGEPFEIADIGPHWLMSIAVDPARR